MSRSTKEGQIASLLSDLRKEMLLSDLRNRISGLAWYCSKDLDKWDIDTARNELASLGETLDHIERVWHE